MGILDKFRRSSGGSAPKKPTAIEEYQALKRQQGAGNTPPASSGAITKDGNGVIKITGDLCNPAVQAELERAVTDHLTISNPDESADSNNSGSFIAPPPIKDTTPSIFTPEKEGSDRGQTEVHLDNIRFIQQVNLPGRGLRTLIADKDGKLFRFPAKIGPILLSLRDKGSVKCLAVSLTPEEFKKNLAESQPLTNGVKPPRPYELVGEFNKKIGVGSMTFDPTKLDGMVSVAEVDADHMKAGNDPVDEVALLMSFKEGSNAIIATDFQIFVANLKSGKEVFAFNPVKTSSHTRIIDQEIAKICKKTTTAEEPVEAAQEEAPVASTEAPPSDDDAPIQVEIAGDDTAPTPGV